MVDAKDNLSKISKGVTKRIEGTIIEDRYLTVTGKKLKEVAEEFDKRWEKE